MRYRYIKKQPWQSLCGVDKNFILILNKEMKKSRMDIRLRYVDLILI